MRPNREMCTAAIATLVTVSGAAAQDAPGSADAPLDEKLAVPGWTVRFEPFVWYVAPGGDLKLPGGGQDVKLEVMDMDNPRLSPAAEFDLKFGNWRFTLGGFSFQGKTDASAATESGQIGGVSFSAGDLLKSELDLQSFQATAGYRVWEEALNPRDGIYALVFGLDVLAGARIYDVSASVQQAAGPDVPSTSEFFAEPIAGVRADFDFYRAFSIDLRTTAGYMPGDRSVWSLDIALSGVYRPVENVGVMIGYRQLLFDLDSGDGDEEFRFSGGLAGLFAGIELRF